VHETQHMAIGASSNDRYITVCKSTNTNAHAPQQYQIRTRQPNLELPTTFQTSKPPSQLSQYALYAAAALSALSVIGHTQMGFELVYPSLRTVKAGSKDRGA